MKFITKVDHKVHFIHEVWHPDAVGIIIVGILQGMGLIVESQDVIICVVWFTILNAEMDLVM